MRSDVDARVFNAIFLLNRAPAKAAGAVVLGDDPTEAELEDAGRALAAFITKTHDRFAVGALAHIIESYAAQRLPLPPGLAAVAASLLRNPPKRRRGYQPSIVDRELHRTHRSLIAYRKAKGDTLEQACAWVEEFTAAPGPKSAKTLMRRWRSKPK